MEETKRKKDYAYVWIALFLSLFFWVPIINIIVFLPLAIYLSITQIRLQKTDPERYGRLIYPALVLVHSSFSIIVSTIILVLSMIGKL
ncbi:hypothetical protein KY342_04070 [Candidatus Woesearchaeota archaeon]|nr:hypothetical protein [Candidatus Woesearchaeota archaeon]